MSIENEVDQIDEMGIKAIDFEDDMLNLDITFFQSVLDIMKGRGIELSAMNGLYSQTLDIDTLTKMQEAGFSRLNFSLVDTSHAVHATQRRAYPANFLKILDWLEASSFMVEAHFIIGLPGQAPADIIDTLIFLMGKRVLPGPSIYYPAPGSLLFDSLCGDPSTSFRYCRSSVMFEANPRVSPSDHIHIHEAPAIHKCSKITCRRGSRRIGHRRSLLSAAHKSKCPASPYIRYFAQ